MTDSEIRNQIGNNLRFLRTRTFKESKNSKMRHLTQTQLAEYLGVTFQQIQKYENGISQISATKLFKFTELTDTDLLWFLEDFKDRKLTNGRGNEQNT